MGAPDDSASPRPRPPRCRCAHERRTRVGQEVLVEPLAAHAGRPSAACQKSDGHPMHDWLMQQLAAEHQRDLQRQADARWEVTTTGSTRACPDPPASARSARMVPGRTRSAPDPVPPQLNHRPTTTPTSSIPPRTPGIATRRSGHSTLEPALLLSVPIGNDEFWRWPMPLSPWSAASGTGTPNRNSACTPPRTTPRLRCDRGHWRRRQRPGHGRRHHPANRTRLNTAGSCDFQHQPAC